MNNLERWINNYIKNINLNEINWINLNANELNNFFTENYLDKEVCAYVMDKNASKLFPTPLGLYYLNFNSPRY